MQTPNNFSVEIYEKRNDKTGFHNIEGTAVFPFSFGSLLDEAFSQITTIATRYKLQEC